MPLAAGTRLGPYEILAAIGVGGMGEVYRAADTHLGRDVAIKVLPDAFAHDPDRLARLEREARTLASLNHPNIAAIYGLEKSAGLHALVLELVDGLTLAHRIARGKLPPDAALGIAKQIAHALEAAHEHGIIHRDLKPANVKVRPDGTVKVLDFGLAKALDTVPSDSTETASSTITSPAMTQAGVILGTAAYMSPEQAKGRPADRRSDIWAFGNVLFETLTGKKTFTGDSVTDTLAAVVRADPDWQALPPGTPAAIRTLIKRCLQKDPAKRLHHIADARLEIEDALTTSASNASVAPVMRPDRWRRPMAMTIVAGLIASTITGALVAWNASRGGSQSVSRFAIVLPPGDRHTGDRNGVAFAPDGRTIVYSAVRRGVSQLFKHSLDQLEATPIPGTENGLHPFFWPDGEWVGFQIRGPATLKKVPLSGGPPVLLAALPASLGVGGVGGVVGETDDVIFGSHAAGLFRVPAAGGEPEPLTTPDGQSPHRFPFVLPNGRGLLFTVGGMSASNQIAVLPSGAKSWRVLTSGTDAHYLPSGHVVFWRQGSLWAARFDLQRLQVLGEPIPVIQGVRAAPDGRAAGAWSADGSLVYFSPADVPKRTFVWVDRKGIESPLAGPPGPYEAMDLSPDETRVLLRYRPAYGAT